jgi:hypothetical protein
VKAARRVRRAAWGNGPAAMPAPRPRPTPPDRADPPRHRAPGPTRRKLAESKTPMDVLRWLKRRLSDAVYHQLVADSEAEVTGDKRQATLQGDETARLRQRGTRSGCARIGVDRAAAIPTRTVPRAAGVWSPRSGHHVPVQTTPRCRRIGTLPSPTHAERRRCRSQPGHRGAGSELGQETR